MTDDQAVMAIFGLFTGSYAGQLALMYAIMSTLMALIKRWKRLDFLWGKLPDGWKSYVPLGLGGLMGLVQALMIGSTPIGIALWVSHGFLVIGGGQMILYQLTKHTPLEPVLVAIVEAFVKLLTKKVEEDKETYIEE